MFSQKHAYSSQEAADKIGVSKLTLYRWIKKGKIRDVIKDYKNHRIFTDKDLKIIQQFKSEVKPPETKKRGTRKWSREFLALAGSWRDNRSSEEIIHDIYAARHEENSPGDLFP